MSTRGQEWMQERETEGRQAVYMSVRGRIFEWEDECKC